MALVIQRYSNSNPQQCVSVHSGKVQSDDVPWDDNDIVTSMRFSIAVTLIILLLILVASAAAYEISYAVTMGKRSAGQIADYYDKKNEWIPLKSQHLLGATGSKIDEMISKNKQTAIKIEQPDQDKVIKKINNILSDVLASFPPPMKLPTTSTEIPVLTPEPASSPKSPIIEEID